MRAAHSVPVLFSSWGWRPGEGLPWELEIKWREGWAEKGSIGRLGGWEVGGKEFLTLGFLFWFGSGS